MWAAGGQTLCFDIPLLKSSHVPCPRRGLARRGTAVVVCVCPANLLVVVCARSARVGVDNIRVWEETTLAAANKLDEERRKYDEQVCGCGCVWGMGVRVRVRVTADLLQLTYILLHAHGPLAT